MYHLCCAMVQFNAKKEYPAQWLPRAFPVSLNSQQPERMNVSTQELHPLGVCTINVFWEHCWWQLWDDSDIKSNSRLFPHDIRPFQRRTHTDSPGKSRWWWMDKWVTEVLQTNFSQLPCHVKEWQLNVRLWRTAGAFPLVWYEPCREKTLRSQTSKFVFFTGVCCVDIVADSCDYTETVNNEWTVMTLV